MKSDWFDVFFAIFAKKKNEEKLFDVPSQVEKTMMKS